MKVILQERVTNLGSVGDQVNVRPGFARNYLLPRGKALKATNENIVAFENRRSELEKKAAEIFAQAQTRAKALEGFSVTISAQASEEGKLFGSIGPRDIAHAMSEAGRPIEKREVVMPDGPIRVLGEYELMIQLHGEVHAMIKVVVNAS